MCAWEHRGGQCKAATQKHVVAKMSVSEQEKEKIVSGMEGRRIPMLRPMMEPFAVGMKPVEGRFIDNWARWDTGLIKMDFEDGIQGNVFKYPKPRRKIDHMTVKPEELLRRIVEVYSKEGQVVLDPFMGSGTTGLAALAVGRKFIGCEQDGHSFNLSVSRIKER